MKLTIFGATGGIGTQLVRQAIAAGHTVTAIVRDPSRLDIHVPTVQADVTTADVDALRSAMVGSDAVLSVIGPRSPADAGVASTGTGAIVRAARAAGVHRIVVISAAPIGTVPAPDRPHPPHHDPGDGFLMRHVLAPLTKAFLRRQYADLAVMESTVRTSGLDWTIVRPPRLTNRALTHQYRLAYGRNVRRGLTVSRADVADAMLHLLNDPRAIRQTVAVAR